MGVDWQACYARRLRWMTTSAIREILEFAQSPDTISMAGGWPDAAIFPTDQLDELSSYVLKENPQASLQYGLTDGLAGLRQTLAEQATAAGLPARAENVVITSGSQQALDLMSRILLNEGDTVLVENPTFLGALQAFKGCGAKLAPAPMDESGINVERLAQVIDATCPKFIYLIPTFQNPTGVTLSLSRRRAVVEIAERAGVAIIEDDPYGALRYEGPPLPTLASLDAARWQENSPSTGYVRGNVVYLGSFSKTLAPGLRVGWAVCPADVAQQMVMAKQGSDVHSSALGQAIVYEFLRRGWLPAQVQRICATYRARRDAMLDAISTYLPPEITVTRPQGGLFLWLALPGDVDTVPLLKQAVQKGVAFVPGGPFHVDGAGRNTIRLSFASVPPDMIHEGIQRLASVLTQSLPVSAATPEIGR